MRWPSSERRYQGVELQKTLCLSTVNVIQVRCHPLLWDSGINSLPPSLLPLFQPCHFIRECGTWQCTSFSCSTVSQFTIEVIHHGRIILDWQWELLTIASSISPISLIVVRCEHLPALSWGFWWNLNEKECKFVTSVSDNNDSLKSLPLTINSIPSTHLHLSSATKSTVFPSRYYAFLGILHCRKHQQWSFDFLEVKVDEVIPQKRNFFCRCI